MYDTDHYKPLIGATVSAILMSEDELIFQTDRGLVGYRVEGACCSHSYFYDFHGVRNLLENGPVVAFESVDLAPGDPGYHGDSSPGWDYGSKCPECGKSDHDSLAVYGYRITTEHPTWGPVTSVFSFRNDSNGYYGGWMEPIFEPHITDDLVLIDSDKVGD